MANDRESLAAAKLHLETTRQNLIDVLAKEGGSQKTKQKTREALANGRLGAFPPLK